MANSSGNHRLSIGKKHVSGASRTRPAVMLALAMAGMTPLFAWESVQAANATWVGGTGTQAWATGTNWSPSAAPGATGGTVNNTDTATFNTATTGTSVTIDSGRNIDKILFDTSAGAFTIGSAGANGGNPLLLTSNGSISLGSNATSFLGSNITETINAPLVLEANFSFINNSTNATDVLSFAGSISDATSTTAALTLSSSNAGANTVSGVIAYGPTSGAINLTNNTGSWTLTAANTFTGSTTVSAGTLTLGNANALGNSAGVLGGPSYATLTVNSGSNPSVLDLHGFSINVGNLGGGSGTVSAQILNNGSTLSGLTVGNNNTGTTYSGIIADGSGGVALTKIGSGTETLAGQNTYSGGTMVVGIDTTSTNGPVSGLLTSTLSGSGTPFGTGPISLNGGAMSLAPGTTGITALSGASLATGTQFTYGGTSDLKLTRKDASSTLTFTVGGGGANPIARNGNGVLVIIPSATTTLSSSEFFKVNGTAPATHTLDLGNAMVNPSIVGFGVSAASIYDFLNYDPTNGFELATYSRTITATQAVTTNANELLSVAPAATTAAITIQDTGNHAFGLMINSTIASPTIVGTITLGNGSGQAGLILDGPTSGNPTLVAGTGTINFGAAEGVVVVAGAGGYTNLGVKFTGSGGVTFSGDGNLMQLGSANTFTGGITLNTGFNIGAVSDGGFGDASNTITFNGGGFDGNLGQTAMSTGRAVVITAAGTTFDGNNSYWSFNGNIAGTGIVRVTSNGASNPVLLTGNNSFAGVNLNSGDLDVASDANLGGPTSLISFTGGTLAVIGTTLTNFGAHPVVFGSTTGLDIRNPANTFTVSQPITIAGSQFTKTGAGTLILTGVSNYTGTTNVNGGVLKLDASQGGSLAVTAPAFAGGTLWLLGNTNGTSQTLGNLTVNAGGGILKVDSNTAGATTLTLGTLITTANGGALNIIQAGTTPANSIVKTTTAADATGIIGTGRVVYNGSDWATSTGTTPFVIGPYSGYSALSTAGGTTDTNNSRITASATLGAGITTTNTLKIENPAAAQSLTIGTGNTLTLTAVGLLFTGSQAFSIDTAASPGTLSSASAASSDLIVHQFSSADLTINSVIAGTGTATLTKAGTGRLILTAANTYTGATFVDAGILGISNVNQLGATATSNINLNGGVLQYTGGGTATTNHPIVLGGSGGTIDLTNNTTLSVTGAISGAALTVTSSDNGGGVLALAASNSFTGGLYINSGTVRITASAGFPGTGSGTVGGSNPVAFGSAAIEQLQLNGFSPTLAGLTSASSNAIVENGIGSGTSGAATLTVNNGDNETFAGSIQQGTGGTVGALTLIKGGGGTWTLTGTNSYSGATTIQNGAISVASITNNLGTGTTINIGDGATAASLIYTGTSPETTSRIINLAGLSGGATIDQSGTSQLKLTGNFTAIPSLTTSLAGAANKTLTLQGSTIGTGEIAGAIVDSTVTGGGSGITAVTKTGTGAWILSGTSTYTGATTVNQGVLNITGKLGNTAVTVNNNATLGGSGTIGNGTGAAVLVNGKLAPSILTPGVPQILTIAGSASSVTLSPSSTYSVTLTVPTQNPNGGGPFLPTGGNDTIIFANTATAAGTLLVNDTAYAASKTAAVGDEFFILDGAPGSAALVGSGSFTNGSTIQGSSGFTYSVTDNSADFNFTDPQGSHHDVILTTLSTSVPEPGALALLALAGAGLLARRRNRMLV